MNLEYNAVQFYFSRFFLFGATATVGHGLLIHEFTRPNTQLRTPVGRNLLELEDEVTSDDDKCRCLKRGWQMISKCNGSFR